MNTTHIYKVGENLFGGV